MLVDFKISILISIVVVLLGQCAFNRNIEILLINIFRNYLYKYLSIPIPYTLKLCGVWYVVCGVWC